jgi:hypothetical protein
MPVDQPSADMLMLNCRQFLHMILRCVLGSALIMFVSCNRAGDKQAAAPRR